MRWKNREAKSKYSARGRGLYGTQAKLKDEASTKSKEEKEQYGLYHPVGGRTRPALSDEAREANARRNWENKERWAPVECRRPYPGEEHAYQEYAKSSGEGNLETAHRAPLGGYSRARSRSVAPKREKHRPTSTWQHQQSTRWSWNAGSW